MAVHASHTAGRPTGVRKAVVGFTECPPGPFKSERIPGGPGSCLLGKVITFYSREFKYQAFHMEK